MIGLVALGVMLVAYQIYALAIEPWIDPPLARQASGTSDDEFEAGRQGLSRYQRVLASYFPEDHWSLVKPPIVVESGQMMLVISHYGRNDNGSIDIAQCAVLLFPTPRVVGQDPPRDAIVLEAPGGAHLQFDDDFDPARGKAGRIVHGSFPGVITIRSEMDEVGPHDDLLIETRDLTMNGTVIKTLADVRFRYGDSEGGGRHLEIGLDRDDDIRQGMNLVGVKSLEIRENVSLRLELAGLSLTGDQDRVALGSHSNMRVVGYRSTAKALNAPVTVACDGSFFMDVLHSRAIFENKVRIRQQRLEGPFDSLDCHQLSLHFARLDSTGNPIADQSNRQIGRQPQQLSDVSPYLIEATGGVRLDSAAQQLSARADRIAINLPLRELTLDTGKEIALKHGHTELRVAAYGPNGSRTPRISYRHPPGDVPQSLGDLTVVGSGWLSMKDRDRGFRLKWQQVDGGENALVMRRLDGQPVLSILGAPEIESEGLGRLTARGLQLFLREVVADGPDGPAIEIEDKPHKLAILPDRLAATGNVEINSPQLTGTTQQLQVWFRAAVLAPSEAAGVVAVSHGGAAAAASTNGPSSRRFDIESQQVSIDVAMSGKRAEAVNATCQGKVVFRETAGTKPGEEPLRVEGQILRVEQLATQPTITVRGTPAAQAGEEGLASISARGLTLYAGQVNADAEKSRFWVEGPGKARIVVDGAVIGETRGTKVPVHINWRGGLSLDGKRIVCSGDIFAESEHSWMQCDRIVGHLTRPIYPAPSGDDDIELAKLSLLGNIVVDNRTVDTRGQRSHNRVQIKSLDYDHATGEISGTGPGAIRTAHLSSAALSNQRPTSPDQSPARLRYLRLDFQEGISGNAQQRVLRFNRRVRGIYGPIDGWQQELFMNDPAGLPPETVVISCEMLQLNEDPSAPRPDPASQFGMMEAVATGNVFIEGSPGEKGKFSASAPRATFNQAKDTFVLEGNRGSLAKLFFNDPRTGRDATNEAEKIWYFRAEPRVKIEGVQQLNVNPNRP
jgi:hypothetical protein